VRFRSQSSRDTRISSRNQIDLARSRGQPRAQLERRPSSQCHGDADKLSRESHLEDKIPWTAILVTLCTRVRVDDASTVRCSNAAATSRDARLPGSDPTIARNAHRATSPDYPREESAPRGRQNRAAGSGGIRISSLIGERRRPTQFPAGAPGFVKRTRD